MQTQELRTSYQLTDYRVNEKTLLLTYNELQYDETYWRELLSDKIYAEALYFAVSNDKLPWAYVDVITQ